VGSNNSKGKKAGQHVNATHHGDDDADEDEDLEEGTTGTGAGAGASSVTKPIYAPPRLTAMGDPLAKERFPCKSRLIVTCKDAIIIGDEPPRPAKKSRRKNPDAPYLLNPNVNLKYAGMGILDRVAFAPPPGSDPADSVAHSDGDGDPSATLPPGANPIEWKNITIRLYHENRHPPYGDGVCPDEMPKEGDRTYSGRPINLLDPISACYILPGTKPPPRPSLPTVKQSTTPVNGSGGGHVNAGHIPNPGTGAVAGTAASNGYGGHDHDDYDGGAGGFDDDDDDDNDEGDAREEREVENEVVVNNAHLRGEIFERRMKAVRSFSSFFLLFFPLYAFFIFSCHLAGCLLYFMSILFFTFFCFFCSTSRTSTNSAPGSNTRFSSGTIGCWSRSRGTGRVSWRS
jgi:hypothetical protein